MNKLCVSDIIKNYVQLLQGELKMIKISKDREKVPEWLKCKKTMIPDFVAENPKASFTNHLIVLFLFKKSF